MNASGELDVVHVGRLDDSALEEFFTQCDLAIRLSSHPHILTIHDFGLTTDGVGFVTTDPAPGQLLASTLASEGSLALAAALRITITLAGALQTAHQAGFVHCAVSPASVVLGPAREPLLADLVRDESLTAELAEHAAPELLHGGAVTPASDVYALASTAYTMLAGRSPRSAQALNAAGATLEANQMPAGPDGYGAPPEVPAIGRHVPEELDAALARALAPYPVQRTPSVEAFAQELVGIQRQLRHPETQPVVLDVSPAQPRPGSPGSPGGTQPAGDAGPMGGGRSDATAADRWWRHPGVYVGALVAVALVAGVVVITGALDGSDDQDPGASSARTTNPSVPSDADELSEPLDDTVPAGGDPAGDGPGDGASPDGEPGDDPGDGGAGDGPAPLEGLTAAESPIGVQLDWEGEVGESYVVRVTPQDGAEAWLLTSTGGPSQLVPIDGLEPGVAYCFAVARLADATSGSGEAAEAGDDVFSAPACVRDG